MPSKSFVTLPTLFIFLMFCLSNALSGTCLSYGHSCWGGHGKRNNMAHVVSTTFEKRNGEWLFNTIKENGLKPKTSEKFRNYRYRIIPIPDSINLVPRDEEKISFGGPRSESWVEDDNPENIFLLTPEVEPVSNKKYNFLQIVGKSNAKKIAQNY